MYNIDQKIEYLGKEYVVLVKMFKNESRDCNQYPPQVNYLIHFQ